MSELKLIGVLLIILGGVGFAMAGMVFGDIVADFAMTGMMFSYIGVIGVAAMIGGTGVLLSGFGILSLAQRIAALEKEQH